MSKGIGHTQKLILEMLRASERPLSAVELAKDIRHKLWDEGRIGLSEHSAIVDYTASGVERGLRSLLKRGLVERGKNSFRGMTCYHYRLKNISVVS